MTETRSRPVKNCTVMHDGRRVSEEFAADKSWPVVPPDEYWLYRWHWLSDEDGMPYLLDWYYRGGWHGGINGRPDPEDMEGWTYLEPALPPTPKTTP